MKINKKMLTKLFRRVIFNLSIGTIVVTTTHILIDDYHEL